MELLSQRPLFSTDPCTKGFDLSSGNKWIYPENYPIRDYQFNIVKSALYHNTLVCLPTGLGKTFIAAVVMYNFWRWYPQGKIVFLAPTKPLVAQQINACQDIMGIPCDESIELTGATDQKKRQIAWAKKRIIFATPQVFQKDLEKSIIPTELVKCIVVDEAHRALGKHSYCESVRLLSEQSQYFRVLGLSATPGGKLDAVQDVVRNLHITHLELRDDTSPDIIPYINERKLDIVLVGLGADLEQFKERYIAIMDRHVRVLVDNNIIRGHTGNISKGRIFLINKEWHQRPNKGRNHGQITKTLMILLTMYHAYELMIRHGLRAFYNFYQKHEDKFWLSEEQALMQLLEEINYYLGPFPDMRPMPDGSLPEIPKDIRFGHNKFTKLQELLLRHFESYEDKEENTRAIVFVEFRDIVNEVYILLLQSMPLLRPQKFVGQAGQKQKQQKKALEDFRSNKVNVLISTSVGEEGLDVGEVDLIVCFDISQHSPIRLVQRMGRTGRKRDGHIIVLVTDGKEHQTLRSAMSRRDSLNNKVLQSSGIINALYEDSPRMVPDEFEPECMKMPLSNIEKPSKSRGKTKEPKKPRTRGEGIKRKNSKNPDPPTAGSQSSIMRFLKKTQDDPAIGVDENIVGLTANEIRPASTTPNSQCSLMKNINNVKPCNIKLLSSDNAAVEFLTLCTMKNSENENTNVDKARTNPYLPSYHEKSEKIDVFLDLKIPNLQILDCLKDLTYYVEPSPKNDENNDDDIICLENDRFWLTQRVDDYHEFSNDNIPGESKFEAMLDDSTGDSVVTIYHSAEAKNHDPPDTEKVDWGENIEDMSFEGLLDEWSNESRRSIEKNQTNDIEAPKTKKNVVTTDSQSKSNVFKDIQNNEARMNERKIEFIKITKNSSTELGNFEALLDEDSRSSTEKNETDDTNHDKTTNSPAKVSLFEALLDEDSRTSLENNVSYEKSESEATIDGITSTSPKNIGKFEALLNEDSTTSLECNELSEKQETNEKNQSNEKNQLDSIKKFGVFEEMLNTSSDESETQLPIEFSSKRKFAESSPMKSKNINNDGKFNNSKIVEATEKITFDDEFDAFEAHDEKIDKNIETTETFDAPKEKFVSEKKVESDDQESIDLLKDYDLHEILKPEKQHNEFVSDIRELSEISKPTNPAETFSMINSTRNSIADEKLVNIEAQGHTRSSILTGHLNSSSSRFVCDGSNGETSNVNKLQFYETAESEDDIFGADDFTVDSDFEEKINKIERNSFENNVNTRERQESFASPAGNIVDDNDHCETRNIVEETKKISNNSSSALSIVPAIEKKFNHENSRVKDPKFSPNKSFRLELNLANWESKNVEAEASFDKSSETIIEKSKDPKSSAGKSFRLEINSQNSDWNSELFRVRGTNPVSSFDKKQIDETKNPVKNSTPIKISATDLHLDDYDWSSDFETFGVTTKSTKRNEIIGIHSTKSRTTKTERSEIDKIGKIEDTTGWLSTKKPKSRLSLGKKLSRNICKNLLNGETSKKPSSRPDSDSENEFTVSRLETTGTRTYESDYFTKPANPVATLKKSIETSTMNNPKRSIRGPLTLRQNDTNKMNISELRSFAAPMKYAERGNMKNRSDERSLGVGKRKSVSLDLDSRKRKRRTGHREVIKRSRVRSEFIDDEAEVSSNDGHTSGSSGSGDDDLGDFVSYTQIVDDRVDMQAHYLQTVRSPRRAGGFYIRKPRSPSPGLQIYSQPMLNETDAYINDSFCVDEDDEVFRDSTTSDELTELEHRSIKHNRKKRKRSDSTDSHITRKRKVLAPPSDVTSSEDETEKLRRQIQEESFKLKKSI